MKDCSEHRNRTRVYYSFNCCIFNKSRGSATNFSIDRQSQVIQIKNAINLEKKIGTLRCNKIRS